MKKTLINPEKSVHFSNHFYDKFKKQKEKYKRFDLEKLKEIKESSKLWKTPRFSSDLEEKLALNKVNKTTDSLDSSFLKLENTRLSLELTSLEQNFKEKTLWAKDLYEKIRDLKENVLKHESFQNALFHIIASFKDPKRG